MKVALVHDWLTGLRGGEKCLLAFLKIYPQADIFTLLHVPGSTAHEIDRKVKQVSFLNRLPLVRKYYRFLLPLYPAAVRTLNLQGYDLVISLSHAAAKNVRVPEGCVHICYCFTPMRYIWDQASAYFGRLLPFVWPIISRLRRWDLKGSARVDHFIAISSFVAARIRRFYKRKACVIFPPMESGWIKSRGEGETGEAFLCAGALVPYKKIDHAIEAFNRNGQQLWIVGSGPEEARLRRAARENITFFGFLDQAQLADRLRRCRALIFPGTEDYGLVPVECMAAGRPVIGLFDGGLKETVNGLKPWINSSLAPDNFSGVFIRRRSERSAQVESIIKSVEYFMRCEDNFSAQACRDQAGKFSEERFFAAWSDFERRIGLPGQEAFVNGSASIGAL
ncbi:MAG: glycosyltransferase [Deltaproteobacteria bacterium]|nr:glycosyltransferase [Deltaproteobacteria bacterium]